MCGTPVPGLAIESDPAAELRVMRSPHVLLIDDDEDDFVIIRDLIDAARHARYVLSWESTYVAGHAALLSGAYDVCLLDYRLDLGNGIDFVRSVTAEGCTTPIVMLTGRGDDEIDTAAMKAGAADYLVKGEIDTDDLERALRHAIERAAGWRSIRQADAKHRAMLAGIPDTVLRVSRDGAILDYRAGIASDPAVSAVGDNATLVTAMGEDVAATLMDCLEATMVSGAAHSCEFTRAGAINLAHFEARIVPIDEANEAVVIVRDFTDEKAAAMRLDDLTQAKDRFLGGISHDLRTPLTAVLGYSDLLRTEGTQFTPSERSEMLDAIGVGAATIGDLFEDALVMARHEIDSLVITPTRVDLAWHAAKVAESIARDGAVEMVAECSAAFAEVDPVRLDQILRHLISNAVVHGGPHRMIVTGESDGKSWIEVRDDGTGIPGDERPWIFDPLGRSSRTLNTAVSAGVGLTVSHRLASLMDGVLTYAYESGWSKFRLEFPAAGPRTGSEPVESVDAAESLIARGLLWARMRGVRGSLL